MVYAVQTVESTLSGVKFIMFCMCFVKHKKKKEKQKKKERKKRKSPDTLEVTKHTSWIGPPRTWSPIWAVCIDLKIDLFLVMFDICEVDWLLTAEGILSKMADMLQTIDTFLKPDVWL